MKNKTHSFLTKRILACILLLVMAVSAVSFAEMLQDADTGAVVDAVAYEEGGAAEPSSTEETEQPPQEQPSTEETNQPQQEQPSTEEAQQPTQEQSSTEEAEQPPQEQPSTEEAEQPPQEQPSTEETQQPPQEQSSTEVTRKVLDAYLSSLSPQENRRFEDVRFLDENGSDIAGAPAYIVMGEISENLPELDGYSFDYAQVEGRSAKIEYFCVYDGDLYCIRKGENALTVLENFSGTIEMHYTAPAQDAAPQETEEDGEPQETETEAELPPDPMTVAFLEEVMGLNGGQVQTRGLLRSAALAPAAVYQSVRVVDQFGNVLSGGEVPSQIPMGWIENAGIPASLALDSGNYDFLEARVGASKCVFVGKYQDTVYYSNDGVSAVELGSDTVDLVYRKYNTVTFNWDGVKGTVVVGDDELTGGSASVKVYADETLTWSVAPGRTENVRYRVASITVDPMPEGAELGTYEYGAEYVDWPIAQDTAISIAIDDNGQYHVVLNDEHVIQRLGTPNGAPVVMFPNGTYGLAFHIEDGYLIAALTLNGYSLQLPEPGSRNGKSVTTTIPGYTVVVRSLKSTDDEGQEKYDITVTPDAGKFTEDLVFHADYTLANTSNSVCALRLYTDGARSGAGMTIGYYNSSRDAISPVEDGSQYDMKSLANGFAKVHIFFFKAQPGYAFVSSQMTRPSGRSNTEKFMTGKIADMPIEWGDSAADRYSRRNYNDLDIASIKASAIAQGYTDFAVIKGENVSLGYDHYTVDFYAVSVPFAVVYDLNAGEDTVENAPETTVYGTYRVGDTHTVQPEDGAPSRAGYRFTGWKLEGDSTGKLYQPGEVFAMTSDNFSLTSNGSAVIDGATYPAYKFVAQWEAIVYEHQYTTQHYLPGADGQYVLKVEETCETPEGTHTVFIIPRDDGDFAGYVPCYTREGTVASAETTDETPFEGTLKLYYVPDYTVSKTAAVNGAPSSGTADNPAEVKLGDTIVYTISIYNPTDDVQKLDGVVVTDDLPAGLTEVPAAQDIPKTLNPGANTLLTLTATVTEAGTYINTASVDLTGDGYTLNLNSNSTGHRVRTGMITVSKQVTGRLGSRKQEFAFALSVNGAGTLPATLAAVKNGEELTLDVTDGSVAFALAHGESIQIQGLPIDQTYTLSEDVPGNYACSMQLDSQDAAAGAFCAVTLAGAEEHSVAVTNNCTDTVPETGVHTSDALRTMTLAALGLLIALLAFGMRGRRAQSKRR